MSGTGSRTRSSSYSWSEVRGCGGQAQSRQLGCGNVNVNCHVHSTAQSCEIGNSRQLGCGMVNVNRHSHSRGHHHSIENTVETPSTELVNVFTSGSSMCSAGVSSELEQIFKSNAAKTTQQAVKMLQLVGMLIVKEITMHGSLQEHQEVEVDVFHIKMKMYKQETNTGELFQMNSVILYYQETVTLKLEMVICLKIGKMK